VPEIVTIKDATLYLGDCREILPTLKVDAVVTDPPYGVNFQYEGISDDEQSWYALMKDIVPKIQNASSVAVMPACDQMKLGWWLTEFPPSWLVCWHKFASPTLSKIGFNDWEAHLVWGKPPAPIHDHFSAHAAGHKKFNAHPCPKPIAYSEWLVSKFAKTGATVADPFMGSGTTGVACANLGRKFIGMEIERKYFDIACERIEAAYSQGRLFA